MSPRGKNCPHGEPLIQEAWSDLGSVSWEEFFICGGGVSSLFWAPFFIFFCHIHSLLTCIYHILKMFPDALEALILTFGIYLSILFSNIQNILFCHLFWALERTNVFYKPPGFRGRFTVYICRWFSFFLVIILTKDRLFKKVLIPSIIS